MGHNAESKIILYDDGVFTNVCQTAIAVTVSGQQVTAAVLGSGVTKFRKM